MKKGISFFTGPIKFYFIGLFCLSTLSVASQIEEDSLLNIIKTSKDDSLRASAACNLVRLIYHTQTDSAVRMCRAWVPLTVRRKIPKWESGFYWALGQCYKEKGILDSALKNHLQALKIREGTNDKEGMSDSYSGIGQTYQLLVNYPQALVYFNKGLVITQKAGDKYGEAAALHNIGTTYSEMHEYTKAKEYIQRSLAIKKQMGNMAGYINGIMNLGNIYEGLGEFKKADSCFYICYDVAKKKNAIGLLVVTYINLGSSQNDQKQYKKAIDFFEKVLPYLSKIKLVDYSRHTYQGLHESYEGLKDYKNAYFYFKKYKAIEDSMLVNDNLNQVKEMESKYHSEKKEQEIQLLSKDKKVQDVELQKRKNMLLFFAVLLLLFIFLTVMVIRNNLNRKKANKELAVKNSLIEHQKHIVEEKHREITDSINYAERIQRSFLATEQHLKENLHEYFVLFKPKDVVSGDFYWSSTLDNGNFAIVTADSTGHGVPGAIMSLLNITSLEKAIETTNEPSEILNKTRHTIISRLKRDGSAEGGKDGMDCSLCIYNIKQMKLFVSAANNPVWIVRTPVTSSGVEKDREVVEVKPDKMPVGKHDRQDVPFTTHEIDLRKGDVVFTLTDGFPDQFGGEKGKKFMSKNLRELLSANAHLPMSEIKNLLEQTFKNWVGPLEQVDDVTVIGIRI